MTRTLNVFIDREQAGVLHENTGIWSFQYDPQWLASGYELAPGLPLQTDVIVDHGTVRPVQWFFDNLLPEEAARSQLIASLPAGSADAWDLLAHFGAESAGALTLLPPGVELGEGGLQPLSDEALEARIRAMPRQSLAADAPKKMSLAGAQQKLPVVVAEDGNLFEPTGAWASTHILKPDVASEYFPCSAVNEWFCACLAQRLGLNVPEVALRFVPSPVYIIKRFDRNFQTWPASRRHALDAAQLLTLSAGAKYAKSGVEALVDIVNKCEVKLTTRTALFNWTLFNIIVGNNDAHLKNLSVVATARGYNLAPHYDLVSAGSWYTATLLGRSGVAWPDIAMAFPIAGALTYKEVRWEHLERFARQLGVPSSSLLRARQRLLGRALAVANELLDEFAARKDVPIARRAAQIQMLRTIIHMPIAEMTRQLAGK